MTKSPVPDARAARAARVRHDLLHFFLSPPVALFTAVLTLLLDRVLVWAPPGLAAMLPTGYFPFGALTTAALVAAAVALAARLREWTGVVLLALMAATLVAIAVCVPQRWDPWFRCLMGALFMGAPLGLCQLMVVTVRLHLRFAASHARRDALRARREEKARAGAIATTRQRHR